MKLSMFRVSMFRVSMFRVLMFRVSMFRVSMFRGSMFKLWAKFKSYNSDLQATAASILTIPFDSSSLRAISFDQ